MPKHIQDIYKGLLKDSLNVEEFLERHAQYTPYGMVYYDEESEMWTHFEFDGFDSEAAAFVYEYRVKK